MQRKQIIAYSIIAGIVILIGGSWWYKKRFHELVKTRPKMYCYQTYFGPVNAAFFVTEKSFIPEVVAYYEKMDSGEDKHPMFDFPPRTLPPDTCVYVMGYNEDSTAADVVCYARWRSNSSYQRGYVSVKTLHKKPITREEAEEFRSR